MTDPPCRRDRQVLIRYRTAARAPASGVRMLRVTADGAALAELPPAARRKRSGDRSAGGCDAGDAGLFVLEALGEPLRLERIEQLRLRCRGGRLNTAMDKRQFCRRIGPLECWSVAACCSAGPSLAVLRLRRSSTAGAEHPAGRRRLDGGIPTQPGAGVQPSNRKRESGGQACSAAAAAPAAQACCARRRRRSRPAAAGRRRWRWLRRAELLDSYRVAADATTW